MKHLFLTCVAALSFALATPASAQTVPHEYPRPTAYVPDALPADSPAEVQAAYNFMVGVLGFSPVKAAWVVANSQTVEALYDSIDAYLGLLP